MAHCEFIIILFIIIFLLLILNWLRLSVWFTICLLWDLRPSLLLSVYLLLKHRVVVLNFISNIAAWNWHLSQIQLALFAAWARFGKAYWWWSILVNIIIKLNILVINILLLTFLIFLIQVLQVWYKITNITIIHSFLILFCSFFFLFSFSLLLFFLSFFLKILGSFFLFLFFGLLFFFFSMDFFLLFSLFLFSLSL